MKPFGHFHLGRALVLGALSLALGACAPASSEGDVNDLVSAFDVFSKDNPVWTASPQTFNTRFGELVRSHAEGRYQKATLDLFRDEGRYVIWELNDPMLDGDSIIVLWGTQEGKAVLGVYDVAPGASGGTDNERPQVAAFREHLVTGLDKTFARGRLDR